MPSLRVMSALAVAAIAAKPARGFLAPVAPGRGGEAAGSMNSNRPAAASAMQRLSRSCDAGGGGVVGTATSSRSSSRRSNGLTMMMMAKKKAGRKKKGVKKAAVGKATAGQGGVAVAEPAAAAASAAAAAAAAAVEENAKMSAAGTTIKNRAGGEQPVAMPPPTTAARKATPLDAAAASVDAGGPSPKASGGAQAAGGGATKGFGAPAAPQPRPVQKGLNKGPVPMKAQQGGGAAQSKAQSSSPPPKQTGFDALATGVPVGGQTDHQKASLGGTACCSTLTDVEFSEPESEPDTVRLNKGAGKRQVNGAEMSPADMLQYLRDNNLTIDLETMNPVEIPKETESKMEAFFPYPPANVLAKYSLGAQPKPSQFAAAVIALLPEDEPWNGAKIRPLPELKDFLLANRRHGGKRGMNVISAMMLKAMSEGDLERAKYLKGAAICMTKAEDTITGPFRQAVMFAENRLAPCMGSTVCEEYAGEDAADAAATWVVLKACVAEWELRLREMRGEEIGLHDIFRTMPNPTMGLDEERTAAITGSVQAMGLSFSNNEKLMKGLPAVLRFMDGALGLNTTTDVRRFALKEFCPKEGMAPEDLRLRVRSLITGLDQLPSKSYHQLQVAVADVYECLAEGTEDEYCLYLNNWEESTTQGEENLSFQSYRLDTGEVWRNRLREIVTTPVPVREDKDDYEVLFKEILPKSLWNFAASDETDNFELPFVYLKKGWWDSLDYLDPDRVAEMRAREAEEEALVMEDPSLRGEEEDDGEMDDIFTDFMKEQELEMSTFEFTEEDFADDGNYDDIRDGPGPGMEEVDLGFEGGPGVVDFGL
ncbi:unnamed protein product [Ectocarpus sp. 12 AP-2014]